MKASFERLLTRTSPLLLEAAAGVFVLVGAIARLSGAEGAAVQLAFSVAVALGTLGGGWRAGIIWMVPPAFLLVSDGASSRTLIVALECLAAYFILGLTREAVAALRRSRATLEAVLAPMVDVILTLDRDGTYLDIARTGPGLLLKPDTELRGRKLADVFPPDIAARFVTQIRRALAFQNTMTFEYEISIEGADRWFSAHVTPVGEDQVVWVARNITAQKQAEIAIQRSHAELETRVSERTRELQDVIEALQQQELRRQQAEDALRHSDEIHRNIVDQASDIISTMTPDGRILSLNSAFQKILGRDPEAWVGRQVVDLVMPEGREAASRTLATAAGGEKLPVVRMPFTASDGRNVTLELALVVQKQGSEVAGLLAVARDVTESKIAEEKLRRSEERFRLVSQATNDTVWEWDLETNRIWRSEGFDAELNPDQKSAVTMDVKEWRSRIHPEDAPLVIAGLMEAIESGQDAWSDEYRLKKADGSYQVAFDRGYIERDANRRARRVTGAMTDVTERKLLEDQLAHTRRVHSLGRVAASIAHEFNNVLMGVQPNLELVRRHATPDQAIPLSHVLQAVQRGKRITDEILRFTRPSDPELSCVGVAGFLESWRAEVGPILGSGIEIEIGSDISELFMNADPLQIGQVLTNLALNARDAMDGRGRITVHAEAGKSFSSYGFGVVRTPDGYVHLRMTDSGSGMTRDTMLHVFEPLFTTKRGGTGLGLAISYQLVARHLGHMFVESEEGVGTTFHVMIPATHPVIAPKAVPAPSLLSIQRILIVEDEVAVASGLKALLELDGVNVEIAATGGEALAATERFRPDVVILDIGLPDMDGLDVYAGLANRWPRLPILFSSGHANPAELDQPLKRPDVSLLTKPYDYERLRQALYPLINYVQRDPLPEHASDSVRR